MKIFLALFVIFAQMEIPLPTGPSTVQVQFEEVETVVDGQSVKTFQAVQSYNASVYVVKRPLLKSARPSELIGKSVQKGAEGKLFIAFQGRSIPVEEQMVKAYLVTPEKAPEQSQNYIEASDLMKLYLYSVGKSITPTELTIFFHLTPQVGVIRPFPHWEKKILLGQECVPITLNTTPLIVE